MKLFKWIKYRRLQRLVLDVCSRNKCATCPSAFKYANGETGCHVARFLFDAAAKTYGIPESALGLDEKKKEE